MESRGRRDPSTPSGGSFPRTMNSTTWTERGHWQRCDSPSLFRPGTDVLILYHYMFPRIAAISGPKPSSGPMAELPIEDGPCPSCTALLDNWGGRVAAT